MNKTFIQKSQQVEQNPSEARRSGYLVEFELTTFWLQNRDL